MKAITEPRSLKALTQVDRWPATVDEQLRLLADEVMPNFR